MRNQKEWQSNRGYIQHLQVLKKISSRNIRINRKGNLKHQNTEPILNDSQKSKLQDRVSEGHSNRFKQTLALKDRKRIIETPPVISKRQLDEDFQKHKRLVECLTSSSTRKAAPLQIRIKKLQEYKENVEHQHESKITHTIKPNMIRLQLNNLTFYRQKPLLDNLQIIFSYSNKNGKLIKNKSQNFPAQDITQKHFYFGISKRLINQQQAITIQIKNLKGLNQISIGHFSFPSSLFLNKYQSQIYHCGKIIGQISISTTYIKRDIINKTQDTQL